jgi:hypothetical protein
VPSVEEVLPSAAETVTEGHDWNAREAQSWSTVISNPLGVSLNSVRDSAQYILGMNPAQICENLPAAWRVLYMESVLRGGLVSRFFDRREKLYQDLRKPSRERLVQQFPPIFKNQIFLASRPYLADLIENMTQPRLTFHGTPRHNVSSIVSHGFLMPGTKIEKGVVASPMSGTVFDRGIYSSQESFYALSFAQAGGRPVTASEIPECVSLFVLLSWVGRSRQGGEGQIKARSMASW